MRRSPRTVFTMLAVVGLVTAGLAAAGSAQAGPGGSQRAHAARVSTAVHQRARLHASYARLPHSTRHSSGGAVSLGEHGALQRYVDRSNSPRPAVRHTSNGARRLQGPNDWLPTVAPTPVSTTRPGSVTGWQGLTEYDNQTFAGFSLEPPDQGLCAGNGHVLEMINVVLRVYSTSGTPEHAPVYLNDFFGEQPYQFTTDPSCTFDAGSGRFFATELTLDVDPNTGDLTGQNWLDLAVSKTGDPLGGWNVYRINVTDDGTNGTPSHTDCPCVGDFPHLATDANGVFLTTNEYPFSSDPGEFGNNFNGAQVYALSKAATVAGTSNVGVVHFENVQVPTSGGPRMPGFTLWPAQAAGSGYARLRHGTQYFVSSMAGEEARPDDFTGHSDQLGLWWISNTRSLNSTPDLQLRVKVLQVGSYGIPPLAEQKIGPTPLRDCLDVQCVPNISDPYTPEEEGGLDSSDTRPLTAVFAGGRIYSALDTAELVSGNVQSGFEWFALGAHGKHSSVARHGYLGVRNGNVIYPTIATDGSGHGYLGVTLSGARWFPSAAYARWDGGAGPTVHVAARGRAPEDGFCEYLAFNCAQTTPLPEIRPRWGDYGYAAWDGHRFFVANEYIAARCSFATFNTDHTCGGTRTFYGNFSTHIQVLR